MKNIHLIPTDKPSRLHLGNSGLVLCDFKFGKNTINGQNIYITSDEEIKEGDYCISHLNVIDEGKIHNTQTIFNPKTKEDLIALQSCKKIILTTDQDLIKDGVQPIDDTFLEWFVKNPSCERVEVVKYDGYLHFKYMIIIPSEEYKITLEEEKEFRKKFPKEFALIDMIKLDEAQEEPKQEIKLEDIFNDEKKQGVKDLIDAHKQETLTYTEAAKKEERIFNSTMMSNQETLEEAAENYANKKGHIPTTELEDAIFKQGFLDGAKWQQKRMYSEEDMRGMYDKSCGLIGLSLLNDQTENDSRFKKLLEQFKKK
jgi:hypothetical protein